MGAASEMMRLEITKKGKLPAAERYKRIVAKKMEENKQKALGAAYKKPFSLSGKMQIGKMGARAEQALKEIALKKARKLAKDERKMVIVEARNFHNGHITKKGEIYDIAGNVIGKVNTKNGSIVSNTGWGIGKYKPKSMFTNTVITDAINKYSPYYINLRRQQMLEQQMAMAQMGGVYGAMTPDVINVHGQVVPMAITRMVTPKKKLNIMPAMEPIWWERARMLVSRRGGFAVITFMVHSMTTFGVERAITCGVATAPTYGVEPVVKACGDKKAIVSGVRDQVRTF